MADQRSRSQHPTRCQFRAPENPETARAHKQRDRLDDRHRVGLEESDPAADRDIQRDAVACVRALINADGVGLEVVLDHSEDATALACAIAGLTAELLLRQSPETRTAILQVWTEEATRPDGGGE